MKNKIAEEVLNFLETIKMNYQNRDKKSKK